MARSSVLRFRQMLSILWSASILRLFLFSTAQSDDLGAGEYPWDARTAEVAGRLLVLQQIFDPKETIPDQPSNDKTILGENLVPQLSIGPVGTPFTGTSNQDLRYKQSQMMSRNLARMQDLRFNQSQMMSL